MMQGQCQKKCVMKPPPDSAGRAPMRQITQLAGHNPEPGKISRDQVRG